MKCDNCAVNVVPEFTFAIKNNQCPACGKNIMQAERLASYLSLQTLLNKSLPAADAENIANLIVANFEVRQMFKEEPKALERGIIPVEQAGEMVSEEVVEEEEETVEASDAAFKQQQKKEAKEILRKMKQEALGEDDDEQSIRDEALTEALAERLGNANGLVMGEDDTPVSAAVRAKMEYEKERVRQNVVSGSGGAFRRST
jgi:hypothetical protein